MMTFDIHSKWLHARLSYVHIVGYRALVEATDFAELSFNYIYNYHKDVTITVTVSKRYQDILLIITILSIKAQLFHISRWKIYAR